MSNLSLEDFVDFYIEAVSEAVQKNYLSDLDIFYEYIFTRVSERTGLSMEEIKSLHHPFHWDLFLDKTSPLELVNLRKRGSNYQIYVRPKNSPLEKTELTAGILKKYRTLLQQRLDKITKHHD